MVLDVSAQAPRRKQQVGSDGHIHKCPGIGKHRLAAALA